MSYVVLARKYRPQTFEDLVGQDHVARTLANAIASGRIAHAFVFTGVRGVGKTTSARLLAKCLNCVGADGKASGPTATPCNACAPCREITAGQDLDVQEIDGASYNGVDEVRRLQEGVSFRPARDRFKVYVVDEVHMLSTAAWNAFLKTLEEPPPHVKFIFATTEVHKVPVTILSRCQRYDFKLISTQMIARRLERVLTDERIAYDADALQVIAREAAGSMRDAMSLLDQVIAFSGEGLTGNDVTRVLGVADRTVLHELATAVVTGDPACCVRVVASLAEQGFDLTHVAKDVLRHLRNLVVARVCAGPPLAASAGPQPTPTPLVELLDLADEEIGDVVDLARRAELDDLSRLFQGFSRAYDDIVRSGQPRMSLEMTLVRLARRPPLLPLDELLTRIGDLERRLAAPSATGPAPRAGGGTRGATPPGSATAQSGSAPSDASSGRTRGAAVSAPSDAGSGRTRGALALANPTSTPDDARPRGGMLAHPAEVSRTELVRPVVVPLPPPSAEVPRSVPAMPTALPPSNRNAAVPPPGARGASTPALPRTPNHPADGGVRGERSVDMNAWRSVLERMRESRPAIASIYEHAVPLEFGTAGVVIAFAPNATFLSARASEPEALDALRAAVQAHLGRSAPVALETNATAALGRPTVADLDAERRAAETAAARQAIEAHPLVRHALELFDATLRDVKLPLQDG